MAFGMNPSGMGGMRSPKPPRMTPMAPARSAMTSPAMGPSTTPARAPLAAPPMMMGRMAKRSAKPRTGGGR